MMDSELSDKNMIISKLNIKIDEIIEENRYENENYSKLSSNYYSIIEEKKQLLNRKEEEFKRKLEVKENSFKNKEKYLHSNIKNIIENQIAPFWEEKYVEVKFKLNGFYEKLLAFEKSLEKIIKIKGHDERKKKIQQFIEIFFEKFCSNENYSKSELLKKSNFVKEKFELELGLFHNFNFDEYFFKCQINFSFLIDIAQIATQIVLVFAQNNKSNKHFIKDFINTLNDLNVKSKNFNNSDRNYTNRVKNLKEIIDFFHSGCKEISKKFSYYFYIFQIH